MPYSLALRLFLITVVLLTVSLHSSLLSIRTPIVNGYPQTLPELWPCDMTGVYTINNMSELDLGLNCVRLMPLTKKPTLDGLFYSSSPRLLCGVVTLYPTKNISVVSLAYTQPVRGEQGLRRR